MRDVGAYVEGVLNDDLETITETFLETGGEFLVGEVGDGIVTMGAFRPVDETDTIATLGSELPDSAVELTRIRVDAEYQRRGCGRQLCEELERRARSGGATRIVLDAMAPQTSARRLYESMGFDVTTRERIDDVADPFDLVVYEKPLDGDQ